jgi:predicted RNase H-like nuclease (RuvC/YqgF family)
MSASCKVSLLAPKNFMKSSAKISAVRAQKVPKGLERDALASALMSVLAWAATEASSQVPKCTQSTE